VHKKELYDLYRPSNIILGGPNNISVIKPRRMRWGGNVVRIENGSGACRVLV
jgi:hypothetical protein